MVSENGVLALHRTKPATNSKSFPIQNEFRCWLETILCCSLQRYLDELPFMLNTFQACAQTFFIPHVE